MRPGDWLHDGCKVGQERSLLQVSLTAHSKVHLFGSVEGARIGRGGKSFTLVELMIDCVPFGARSLATDRLPCHSLEFSQHTWVLLLNGTSGALALWDQGGLRTTSATSAANERERKGGNHNLLSAANLNWRPFLHLLCDIVFTSSRHTKAR